MCDVPQRPHALVPVLGVELAAGTLALNLCGLNLCLLFTAWTVSNSFDTKIFIYFSVTSRIAALFRELLRVLSLLLCLEVFLVLSFLLLH